MKRQLIVSAAVAAALLSACSNNASDAAVIDGRGIALSDIEQVQDDLAGSATDLNATDTLTLLIAAETAVDEIEAQGYEADADTRSLIESQLGLTDTDYSDLTHDLVTYVAFTSATQAGQVDDASISAVVDAMTGADIVVNPRFGTWDKDRGLVAGRDYLAAVEEAPVAQ